MLGAGPGRGGGGSSRVAVAYYAHVGFVPQVACVTPALLAVYAATEIVLCRACAHSARKYMHAQTLTQGLGASP